jgi:hypothetical protein
MSSLLSSRILFGILNYDAILPGQLNRQVSLSGSQLCFRDQQVLVRGVILTWHDLREIEATPVPHGLVRCPDPVMLQAQASAIRLRFLGQSTCLAGFYHTASILSLAIKSFDSSIIIMLLFLY